MLWKWISHQPARIAIFIAKFHCVDTSHRPRAWIGIIEPIVFVGGCESFSGLEYRTSYGTVVEMVMRLDEDDGDYRVIRGHKGLYRCPIIFFGVQGVVEVCAAFHQRISAYYSDTKPALTQLNTVASSQP